jgi:hypothetical protein
MGLVLALIAEFERLLELERRLVDAAKKSPLTKKLANVDKRIDNAIAGMKAAIKSALYRPEQEIKDAAQILLTRLRDFGNIKSKSYEEESAAVQLLLDQLNGNLAPQVALIGLESWILELTEAEELFTLLFEQRNQELADRPKESLADIRIAIEIIYKKIIACIDADLIVNGDTVCGEFANQLNEQVKYFNEHTHHRTKKNIEDAVILPVGDQTYTGEQIIVMPTVVYKDDSVEPPVDKTLVFATDYTVTYKNNVNPGNATLIVHGKGTFKGKKIISFYIIN